MAKNNALENVKLSSVLNVSARDAKVSFDALSFDVVEGTDKGTVAEAKDVIGAFASVLTSVDKAYYRLSVLAATIDSKSLYRAVVNPDTGKPFATFKELCLSDPFSRVMVNEKGAPLSYSFVTQLSSVGKFFYLPAQSDERYRVFKDMSFSALLPFIPVGNTDAMPALLAAFNGDGEKPAKYNAAKLSVRAARELARRLDNREDILSDKPAESGTEGDSKAETSVPVRDKGKGGRPKNPANKKPESSGNKPETSAPVESKPETSAPAESGQGKKEYFVPSLYFNDGRTPLDFPIQTIEDFKVIVRNVGAMYKNVLILNGTKAAFAVMFTPLQVDAVDMNKVVSETLQGLYKVRAEFAPSQEKPEANAESKPEAPATDAAQA